MGAKLKPSTLAKLFPMDEPHFTKPFGVWTDGHASVHLVDAADNIVATFADRTQLPLGDERALAAELAYWEAEAQRLADALNIGYKET